MQDLLFFFLCQLPWRGFYTREIVREGKGTIKNYSREIPPVKALAYPESKALLIRIKTALKLKVLWDILIVL